MKNIFTIIFGIMLTAASVLAYEYKEVRAEHILVKSKAEAVVLIQQIESGKSFEELAQEYSLCPSGKNGGDLGYFTKGQMVLEFERPAFNMAIGEVSEPIQTQFGWHVIKVLDKK